MRPYERSFVYTLSRLVFDTLYDSDICCAHRIKPNLVFCQFKRNLVVHVVNIACLANKHFVTYETGYYGAVRNDDLPQLALMIMSFLSTLKQNNKLMTVD